MQAAEEGVSAAASSSSAPAEHTQLLKSKPGGVSVDVALPKLITSLHMPRMLGAIHVIFYHVRHYQSFASYGDCWVTFFFMLSAFGAAHSQLAGAGLRKAAESGPWFMHPVKLLRRWISVYPTYLLAFLLAWPLRCVIMQGESTGTCFHPPQLIIEGLMLGGWFPWTTPVTSVNHHWYNIPGWYVCALAGLWFFEPAMIRLAAIGCLKAGPGRIPLFAIVCTLIWLLCSPFAGFPYTWGPAGPDMPAFQSMQIYFSGALLACWLHSRAEAGLKPFRFAASISSLILLAFFSIDVSWFGTDRSLVHGLKTGTNAMVPVFAGLIAGLAGGADPLAVALNWLPLPVNNAARDLATGVYLFQEPMTHIILLCWTQGKYRVKPGTWISFAGPLLAPQLAAYFPALFALAALVHFVVQKPMAKLALDQLVSTPPRSSSDKPSEPQPDAATTNGTKRRVIRA